MRKTSHRHSFIDGLCGCGCGIRASLATARPPSGRAVEQALLHGLFRSRCCGARCSNRSAPPRFWARSSLLPLETLKAIAQEKKPLEKTKLNVGFLPITCAAPLIYGEHLGHYAREGLEVSLQKIAGINLIRDKMINGELDVSQQVMPVALTMTAGLGGTTQSIKVLTICNQNGIPGRPTSTGTNRDPKNGGALPSRFRSSSAIRLCSCGTIYNAGLDPDKDVTTDHPADRI